jgi:urease accessory protein
MNLFSNKDLIMSVFLCRAVFAVSVASLSGIAAAHSGDHSVGFVGGLAHPLVGMDHVLVALAVGFGAATYRNWLPVLAFFSATILGATVGLAAPPVALTEVLLALTVIAAGLLIFFEARHRHTWLALWSLACALFGGFHGFAHLQEMPLQANSLSYVIGLLLSTAGLHCTGYALQRYWLISQSRHARHLTQSLGLLTMAAGIGFAVTRL